MATINVLARRHCHLTQRLIRGLKKLTRRESAQDRHAPDAWGSTRPVAVADAISPTPVFASGLRPTRVIRLVLELPIETGEVPSDAGSASTRRAQIESILFQLGLVLHRDYIRCNWRTAQPLLFFGCCATNPVTPTVKEISCPPIPFTRSNPHPRNRSLCSSNCSRRSA
jgi:hypothetical protein